jgi:hypothetical protein
MKTVKDKRSDFSIIFNEVDKFKSENPLFVYNLLSESDIQQDENIREFSEICQQINSSENTQYSFVTFS